MVTVTEKERETKHKKIGHYFFKRTGISSRLAFTSEVIYTMKANNLDRDSLPRTLFAIDPLNRCILSDMIGLILEGLEMGSVCDNLSNN